MRDHKNVSLAIGKEWKCSYSFLSNDAALLFNTAAPMQEIGMTLQY